LQGVARRGLRGRAGDIEPLTWELIEKVIAAERPDALLPTLGGQTGLNLAMDLYRNGVLEKYGVEMIGADPEAIKKGEDRDLFKAAMEKIGLEVCRGETVKSVEHARKVLEEIGLPCVVRPSFTLGGSGSAMSSTRSSIAVSINRRCTRCSSKRASSAGKSTRWR
jgi:carbamoyl-phosphate synthase large subunit